MTDFMQWLYTNYIWPQLEASDATGYEMALSVLDTSLDASQKREYKRAVEFYAKNAFLLGLRTGCGLGRALTGQNR